MRNNSGHKLTRQQRLFLVRAHFNGMGAHSLARALGVSRSTVRGHIRRAKAKVEVQLAA